MAARFDADRLEILGEAIPVLDGMVHAINTVGSTTESGTAQYGTSRGGLLVYAPGSVYPESSRAGHVGRSARSGGTARTAGQELDLPENFAGWG